MTAELQALQNQLQTIKNIIELIDEHAYCFSSAWLSQSTIGQHSRHVIELAACMTDGYECGEICYDKRKRDKQVETNRLYAVATIDKLILQLHKPDKDLKLEVSLDGGSSTMVRTNYKRELIYNIEHAVHHLALIKVALKELNIELEDDKNIGVAYATIQYRKLCAQ